MQEVGAVSFGMRGQVERKKVPGRERRLIHKSGIVVRVGGVPGQDEHVTGGDAAGDGHKFGDIYR